MALHLTVRNVLTILASGAEVQKSHKSQHARNSRSAVGSPERTAVVERVRDLVEFCRGQGYRPDEVIQMIRRLS